VEEAVFIEVGRERVFAVFSASAPNAQRGIVLCHPLGEEKLWAHRALVNFSRRLAASGFAVIRFDCRGEGDSDRQFEETDLATRIQDLEAVVRAFRSRTPSLKTIGGIGLRFGASLAGIGAARCGLLDHLVLWDPIWDGRAYANSLVQGNLAAQLAAHHRIVHGRERLLERMEMGEPLNVEGYLLMKAFFDDICSIRLADILPDFDGPVLVLQPGQETSAPRPEYAELVARRPDRCKVAVVLQPAFWKETRAFLPRGEGFERMTIDWLETVA
jgi:alpha/beta superfamily hydrolase